MLLIDIVSSKQIHAVHGRSAVDEALRHVAEQARSELQPTDVLFRYGTKEFVALLGLSDAASAAAVAEKICGAVRRRPLTLRSGDAVAVDVVATVTTAAKGSTLRELITAAREQKDAVLDHRPPSVH